MVVLVGILAAIAVPRMNMAVIDEQKSHTFARKLAADLRYARQLALTHAAQNNQGYGLYLTGGGSYTAYEIRDLDTNDVIHSYPIDESVLVTGGHEFRFGPLGNLLSGSDRQIQVTAGDREFNLAVQPATGAIVCTED